MSSSDFYKWRNDSGIYDTMVEDLLQLDTNVLSNIEWNVHFMRDPKDDKQLIYKDGRPFTTLIFGEIAPSSLGSRHSALGNHYTGSSNKKTPNVITDKSTIKDVFMLRRPTDAPDDLAFLYDYQLDNLNKLRHHDAVVEYESGVSCLNITEIPRAASAGADADLIATHLGPKYDVLPGLAAAAKNMVGSSRANGKRVFRSRDDHPSVTRATDVVKTTIPLSSEIVVGAYYDPRLLPDFGGPIFRLVNAKLLQREIVDAEGNLIAPWETYDKLRPGTVILMKVQLLTFEIVDHNGIRKVYQFLIDRIRVMAHSEEEIETPSNSDSPSRPGKNVIADRDETDDALDALFAAKKRKTDTYAESSKTASASAGDAKPVDMPSGRIKTRKDTTKEKTDVDGKSRRGKGKEKLQAGSEDKQLRDMLDDFSMTEEKF